MLWNCVGGRMRIGRGKDEQGNLSNCQSSPGDIHFYLSVYKFTTHRALRAEDTEGESRRIRDGR